MWNTEQEIDNLWDEEQQESLREMSNNSSDSEGHSSEIAISVSNENL